MGLIWSAAWCPRGEDIIRKLRREADVKEFGWKIVKGNVTEA